ncbi:MAG: BBP7 family outer membrane beta-barrel protein [Planctomycetota bacterium]
MTAYSFLRGRSHRGGFSCLLALLAIASSANGQAGVDRHATTRHGSVATTTKAPAPSIPPQQDVVQQATACLPTDCDCPADLDCGCDIGCGDTLGCGDLVGCNGPNIGLTGRPLRLHSPWFRAEYLAWWVDRADTPALVSTSPSADGLATAGQLDAANTEVLFGNGPTVDSIQSGVRFSGGFLLNPHNGLAIEASHFRIDESDGDFSADNTQFDVLARPFENVETGSEGENAIVIAFPGLLDGSVNIRSTSSFEGTEVLLARPSINNGCSRWDFLLGWRNARLEESLTVSDFREVTGTGSGLAVGTTLASADAFNTRTEFNGGVVGIAARENRGRLTWEGAVKLGIGGSATRASISGVTNTSTPDGSGGTIESTAGNGLLAQASNSGVFERDDFALVPELRVGVSYKLGRRLRATAGYSLLYVSRVQRANQLVDRQVNLSQIPPSSLVGPAAPAFAWEVDGLLAQGFNVGLEARY